MRTWLAGAIDQERTMEAAMPLRTTSATVGVRGGRRQEPALLQRLRSLDRSDGYSGSSDIVQVFDRDPDLLAGLGPAASDLLRRRVTVPKLWVEPGEWLPPAKTDHGDTCFGLLVLDGLMIRSLHTQGRHCPELVGAGDLLRPWDYATEASVPMTVSWTALERSTVAVLDERFTPAVCRFPVIMDNVLSRMTQRSRTLAFHLATAHVRHADIRLRMLLWHLADRWGRVTPAGVHLPLALTHETLAHLVCMRRPTASSALQRLKRAGELDRRRDGTWLLTGEPPAMDLEPA